MKLYGVGKFSDAGKYDAGFSGPRDKKTDGPAPGNGVGSKKGKGIGVRAGNDGLNGGLQRRVNRWRQLWHGSSVANFKDGAKRSGNIN